MFTANSGRLKNLFANFECDSPFLSPQMISSFTRKHMGWHMVTFEENNNLAALRKMVWKLYTVQVVFIMYTNL